MWDIFKVVEAGQKTGEFWRNSPWRGHAGVKCGLHLGGGVEEEWSCAKTQLEVLKLGGQGQPVNAQSVRNKMKAHPVNHCERRR